MRPFGRKPAVRVRGEAAAPLATVPRTFRREVDVVIVIDVLGREDGGSVVDVIMRVWNILCRD